MKRVAFFLLTLPFVVSAKESWSSGAIKVVDTNEWCGRPGIPDWPEICIARPQIDEVSYTVCIIDHAWRRILIVHANQALLLVRAAICAICPGSTGSLRHRVVWRRAYLVGISCNVGVRLSERRRNVGIWVYGGNDFCQSGVDQRVV